MRSFFKENKKNIICTTIWLLITTYILVVLNYGNKFLPNTYIDGINVSSKTIYITEKMVKENLLNNYELKIITIDEMNEYISGDEIGVDAEFNINEIKKQQNNLLWFKNLFKPEQFTSSYKISINEEFFNEKINTLNFMQPENITSPSNAKISEYKYGNGYEIEKEIQGNTPIEEKVKDVIKESILNLETSVNLYENECYLNPEITSESKKLIDELNNLNNLIKNKVVYVYGDKEITLDADMYHNWIIKNENKYIIDEEKIKDFVYSLNEIVTTSGKERVFITNDGRKKIVKGPYGYKLDIENEIIKLIEDINSGEDVTRTPVFLREGSMKNGNDYGDTYVEIDLSNQKVYLFVGGKLIKHSDCVTGDMAKKYTTPPGIFGLTYKQRNAILRGRDYASPVSYWMPFNGNIGMHDASWRTKFGGDIYKTDGSHGCINLPKDMAKTLFSNVYQGMPIICYY